MGGSLGGSLGGPSASSVAEATASLLVRDVSFTSLIASDLLTFLSLIIMYACPSNCGFIPILSGLSGNLCITIESPSPRLDSIYSLYFIRATFSGTLLLSIKFIALTVSEPKTISNLIAYSCKDVFICSLICSSVNLSVIPTASPTAISSSNVSAILARSISFKAANTLFLSIPLI